LYWDLHYSVKDWFVRFDYLIELQRHVGELAASPAGWMPWNYRQALKRAGV
jgi:hypothetical protein